jgi:hypothetical protein
MLSQEKRYFTIVASQGILIAKTVYDEKNDQQQNEIASCCR